MKYILIVLSFLVFIPVYAQLNVKTHYKNIEGGYEYFADNNEVIPVSIKVSFKLKNLKSDAGNNKVYLLPANTKNIKLTTLRVIKNGKYSFNSSTKFNYGDHLLKSYTKDFAYLLPFQKGETYKLSQGYNGTISHQNKNQLDFTMPVGTKITAARAGIVFKVLDRFNKHCSTEQCAKYNNYIYVYHNDGTFAEYLHIKQNGAKVKVGDIIKQGQIIAESGNVGWSTGPHLHFSVYLQRLDGKREHLKTKFALQNGKVEYLVEKEKYTKE
ncbi:MAG: M23 family metallopeptidase [Oceanihabitans sp.]